MKRFLVVGHGRSGSTLLTLGIGAHPEVIMHGEVFHEEDEQRRIAVRRGRMYESGEDGGAYLEELFDIGDWDWPAAMGFKLFYFHCQEDASAARAWPWLMADRELHVIHLTRKNLLACLVSFEVAKRTDEWTRPPGSKHVPPTPDPFELEPRECLDFFHFIERHRLRTEHGFREHPILRLEYERDLCERFEHTMARIWDFLELPPCPPRQFLRKQSRRHPSEQVANYAELTRYFASSPHRVYFDDVEAR